jgi:hypothetical protein
MSSDKSQQTYSYNEPTVGHYAYFDKSIAKNTPHYIVNTELGENRGCHYSSEFKKDFEPFVTCHGKITSIKLLVKNSQIIN